MDFLKSQYKLAITAAFSINILMCLFVFCYTCYAKVYVALQDDDILSNCFARIATTRK